MLEADGVIGINNRSEGNDLWNKRDSETLEGRSHGIGSDDEVRYVQDDWSSGDNHQRIDGEKDFDTNVPCRQGRVAGKAGKAGKKKLPGCRER
ncbi:UNVERIFIED_CONTAM: hypothetical protein K2H54_074524 [Gekko kuhli]